jgi:hypothetical protein
VAALAKGFGDASAHFAGAVTKRGEMADEAFGMNPGTDGDVAMDDAVGDVGKEGGVQRGRLEAEGIAILGRRFEVGVLGGWRGRGDGNEPRRSPWEGRRRREGGGPPAEAGGREVGGVGAGASRRGADRRCRRRRPAGGIESLDGDGGGPVGEGPQRISTRWPS